MSTPNGTGDEGASPKELIMEASRRNNAELLMETLDSDAFKKELNGGSPADFLNEQTDALGNMALHVAAHYGSYDVLDHLLDIENLEVDPLDRRDHETPLHKAVKYASSHLRPSPEESLALVELLLDAGADPRIRNKAKQRPVELVDPRNKRLRDALEEAEYQLAQGDDVVQEDEEDEGDRGSESE